MADIIITKYQQIADEVGISLCVVKALAGITQGARMSLMMQLNSTKRLMKAELATHAFKLKISSRKQVEINKLYSSAGAILSQQKRVFNLLNIGPEFNSCVEVQNLINSLLNFAKIKGISLGGYRDIENIVNGLNFEAQQIMKSKDFAENAVDTINKKIDETDKYIKVLTALNKLQ